MADDGMTAIALGVHVLDVLVRPVESIPEGQGGELVEQIKITAAGSAGGTALTLSKLGAEVRSAGAVGTDAVGEMLVALLQEAGVDTSLLVRRDDVHTSAGRSSWAARPRPRCCRERASRASSPRPTCSPRATGCSTGSDRRSNTST